MNKFFAAGAFACAVSLIPGVGYAQDGTPFRTFGVPSITGTIGNTALDGEKTISLDPSGLLTVKDAKGTHTYSLTNADAQNLVNLVNGADLKDVPAMIPNASMIMGATGFDLTIKTADGQTYKREGSAIQSLGKYPGFEKFVDAVDAITLKTAALPPANPVVNPTKSDKFDKIEIETQNPWTQWKDFLTINPDGTYTYTRGGPDVLAPETGKLTPAQLAAIEKSFDANTLAADNGKTIGTMIPDGTLSTITATVNGKAYTVNAYADAKNLGPLAGLEKALMGDLSSVQPKVAPAAADTQGKKSDGGFLNQVGDFFGSVGDTISGWFGGKKSATVAKTSDETVDSVRGVRSKGMSGALSTDIQGATDAADGKDVADR